MRSDFEALKRLKAESSILDFRCFGNPPERYILTFYGKGLMRPAPGAPVHIQQVHEIEVLLGVEYPRMMPELRWRTPIFHPNIAETGMVCLGGYGTNWAPSLNLEELCEMLWDMIRYANYDVKSPYNREAALWAQTQTLFHFPLDPRNLRDLRSVVTVSPPATPRSAPRVVPIKFEEDIAFFDDEEALRRHRRREDDDLLVIE
ncbi:MAG: ubiquitin-conjugating enzyme E2 [Abditibacteriales bacterium]|nr:ubiquitin-conjugating enzyme E2 [Abditibacteriales bacterium]